MDVCAEELHNSVVAGVAIQADVGVVADLLHQQVRQANYKCDRAGAWWTELSAKCKANHAVVQVGNC